MGDKKSTRWIVGITGASGMRYAKRFIQVLSGYVDEVHVAVSDAGFRVLREEEGIKTSPGHISTVQLYGEHSSNVSFHDHRDIGAACASGSSRYDGMVVIPCSMATLGAIAHGVAQNLIHRSAEVTMKEGRRLILVPRETPLTAIHLENMLKLARLGVTILPAMPGFYHQPASIDSLVDMLVMKVLDVMGIESSLVPRWREEEP